MLDLQIRGFFAMSSQKRYQLGVTPLGQAGELIRILRRGGDVLHPPSGIKGSFPMGGDNRPDIDRRALGQPFPRLLGGNKLSFDLGCRFDGRNGKQRRDQYPG